MQDSNVNDVVYGVCNLFTRLHFIVTFVVTELKFTRTDLFGTNIIQLVRRLPAFGFTKSTIQSHSIDISRVISAMEPIPSICDVVTRFTTINHILAHSILLRNVLATEYICCWYTSKHQSFKQVRNIVTHVPDDTEVWFTIMQPIKGPFDQLNFVITNLIIHLQRIFLIALFAFLIQRLYELLLNFGP